MKNKKNKNRKIVISLLFVMFLSILFQQVSIPVVKGITTTYTDDEGYFCSIPLDYDGGLEYNYEIPTDESGAHYNIISNNKQMDIVKLEIDGQFFNLTMAGPISPPLHNFSMDYKIEIKFYETFDRDLFLNSNGQIYPFYEVLIVKSDFSDVYPSVYFIHPKTKFEYPSLYWDRGPFFSPWDLYGNSWDGSNFNAFATPQKIGSVSGSSIYGTIPSEAFNVSKSQAIVAISYQYCGPYEDMLFDFAPETLNFLSNSGAIPGYSVFIMIGALIGISTVLVLMKKRRHLPSLG